jgi:hypothetical protein
METERKDILHINHEMVFMGNKGHQISYPDIGEDLIYLGTYIKGKSNKGIENWRILMEGVETGNKYFVYLYYKHDLDCLIYLDTKYCKKITEEHYKNKVYNYWFFRKNPEDVNTLLKNWLEKNHKIYLYSPFRIKDLENYTHLFEFNGKKY